MKLKRIIATLLAIIMLLSVTLSSVSCDALFGDVWEEEDEDEERTTKKKNKKTTEETTEKITEENTDKYTEKDTEYFPGYYPDDTTDAIVTVAPPLEYPTEPPMVHECYDEWPNKDHKCDECGAWLGDCRDEDNNHYCDECQATMSECRDEDSNGYCDICFRHILSTEKDQYTVGETINVNTQYHRHNAYLYLYKKDTMELVDSYKIYERNFFSGVPAGEYLVVLTLIDPDIWVATKTITVTQKYTENPYDIWDTKWVSISGEYYLYFYGNGQGHFEYWEDPNSGKIEQIPFCYEYDKTLGMKSFTVDKEYIDKGIWDSTTKITINNCVITITFKDNTVDLYLT